MNTSFSGLTGMTRSSTCANIALPATVTSGFGLLHVCGLSRVPSPATGRMMSTVVLQLGHASASSAGVILRPRPHDRTIYVSLWLRSQEGANASRNLWFKHLDVVRRRKLEAVNVETRRHRRPEQCPGASGRKARSLP